MKLVKYCIGMLVLVSIIGTAQAGALMTLTDINGNDLTNPYPVSPGQVVNMSVHASGFSTSIAYVIYTNVDVPTGWDYELFRDIKDPAATSFDDLDLLSVTVPSDAPAGVEYVISISADAYTYGPNGEPEYNETVITYDDVYVGDANGSQNLFTVPEFPTIALPVAAILGLAFFMQRRKDE